MVKVFRMLAAKFFGYGVMQVSTAGANSFCAVVFHDVKKPEEIDCLKKF